MNILKSLFSSNRQELFELKKKMIDDLTKEKIQIIDTAISEDRDLTEIEKIKLDILSIKIKSV